MATLNYDRVGGTVGNVVAEELAAQINTSMAWTDTVCTLNITPTLIIVDASKQTEADRAAVTTALRNYVHDPLFGKTPEEKRLANQAATLRQWSTDAATEANAWATQTATQRDAAMKTTFQRISTLLSHMADVLVAEDLN